MYSIIMDMAFVLLFISGRLLEQGRGTTLGLLGSTCVRPLPCVTVQKWFVAEIHLFCRSDRISLLPAFEF